MIMNMIIAQPTWKRRSSNGHLVVHLSRVLLTAMLKVTRMTPWSLKSINQQGGHQSEALRTTQWVTKIYGVLAARTLVPLAFHGMDKISTVDEAPLVEEVRLEGEVLLEAKRWIHPLEQEGVIHVAAA